MKFQFQNTQRSKYQNVLIYLEKVQSSPRCDVKSILDGPLNGIKNLQTTPVEMFNPDVATCSRAKFRKIE